MPLFMLLVKDVLLLLLHLVQDTLLLLLFIQNSLTLLLLVQLGYIVGQGYIAARIHWSSAKIHCRCWIHQLEYIAAAAAVGSAGIPYCCWFR